MLWPPWETVPECSPQIQAWDYLGGYYIRCRGNFRDSRISEPLGFGWNPTALLPLLTSSSFIHRNASSRNHFAGHRILRIYFNSTTTNLAGLSLTFFSDPKKLFGAHCTPPLGALNSSASSAFEVSIRSTSDTATTRYGRRPRWLFHSSFGSTCTSVMRVVSRSSVCAKLLSRSSASGTALASMMHVASCG